MSWLWPNMTLGIIFFGCWAGIPLWMVLRHPTWGPVSAHGHRTPATRPVPVSVTEDVVFDEQVVADGINAFPADAALAD
jgi:hypothetical protein